MDTLYPMQGTLYKEHYNIYSFSNLKQQLFLLLVCDKGFEKDPILECKMCEKGTYNDKPDADYCTPCPEGQTTYQTRTWTADSCYGKTSTIFEILLIF